MILAQIFQENEDIICLCGNQPYHDGFYSCDSMGTPQHNEWGNPSEDWTGAFHYCLSCKRMIMISEV